MPYGDQVLAITPQNLKKAGGVPLIPILEDYELVLRVRRRVGRILTLGRDPPYFSWKDGCFGMIRSLIATDNDGAHAGGVVADTESTSLTSPRRYERLGVWRACVTNHIVLLAYGAGVSPQRIYGWYYGSRPTNAGQRHKQQ